MAGDVQSLADFVVPLVPISQAVQQQVDEARAYSQDSSESADAAASSLLNLIRRWYGALDADPTTNPLGEPVREGDAYGNTQTGHTRIFLGGSWRTAIDPNDASAVAFLPEGEGAIATTLQEEARERITPAHFMTPAQRMDVFLGVGSLDVTDAVVKAANRAGTFLRNGLVPTVKHPGATLVISRGFYNLATLSGPIRILCNMRDEGAHFVVPQNYAKEVFRIGMDVPGQNLATADITVPNVAKPVSNNLPVAGSVGVRIVNLNASRVRLGRTNYFEVGVWAGGIGEGTAYCDVYLGQHAYCKVLLSWAPGPGGWCNANRFFNGNLLQSAGYAGGARVPGWLHLLMDGRAPATAVVGNSLLGVSFEGNASEFIIDAYNAYGNNGFGCYCESGAPFDAVMVAGDTITQPAHGCAVDDMVSFNANNTPGGMFLGIAYYIVAIPSADTYKVSRNKGKSPATFNSAGAGVTVRRHPRLRFNQSGGELCFNNQLINTFMPPSNLLDVIQTGQAYNNGLQSSTADCRTSFSPWDEPMMRYRNRSFNTRHLVGFYDYDIDPYTQPGFFSMSLGAKGIAFRENGADTGYLSNKFGAMQYQHPTDAVSYEIPSARRSPNLISVSGLSCPANASTHITFPLIGATPNDHLLFTAVSGLPDGLSIAWSAVSAPDLGEGVIRNGTGAAISLTAYFQACAFRRYR